MKKKVFLIIHDRFQKTASGFIESFEGKGNIDGIICIKTQTKSPLYVIKRIVRLVLSVKNRIVRRSIIMLTGSSSMQSITALIESWSAQKENSWDLLKTRFDIFEYAKTKSIALHFLSKLGSAELRSVTAGAPSLFILYAGGIIGNDLINMPGSEFLNAHMGDMPRYRGMNVLEWAVLEGQKPKVSVMVMNTKIDDGDVVYKMDIENGGEATIAELRKTGYEHCYKAMADAALLYSTNKTAAEKQSKEGIRYYYRMHSKIRSLLSAKLAAH